MPFPIEQKYLEEMEKSLHVKFPSEYRNAMINENGGEIQKDNYHFRLYPFFDKSNKKRISRTSNHILKENESVKKWNNFPEEAIAIGSDDFGNQLVFLKVIEESIANEELFFWDHETGELIKIADSFEEFQKTNYK